MRHDVAPCQATCPNARQDPGRWLDLERDPLADMRLAFGETPTVLAAVGLMTDADDTRSRAAARYGPLELMRRRE